ncbi:hypothetical protein [Glycomyces algeriensis]|nr:hypothetical protein [Glycomyces algeriensis]MDA1364251.1 hypothetical protein [Glycomyces algeriensis]MDR7350278.1 hypothetical protein [Glycomyces algeriensis]
MTSATNTDLVALTVSIVSVLVAVLGIMASTRPPKRHMRFIASRPRRLIPFQSPDLGITIAGQDLKDPYITEVRCRSTGRFDFTEANIPDGLPIRVCFSERIRVSSAVGLLPISSSDEMNIGHIMVGPHTVTRKQEHVFWVVTEGLPKVTLEAEMLKDATARLHHVPPRISLTRFRTRVP